MNPELIELRVNSNQLTHLDVSNCNKLKNVSCFSNKIRGDAMDELISSLPNNTTGEEYKIVAIITGNFNEENVCSTSQVAAAKAKGWIIYNAFGGVVYEGCDPSGINGVLIDKQIDAPIYDLSGKRLREPRKGINLISGKKVLVK